VVYFTTLKPRQLSRYGDWLQAGRRRGPSSSPGGGNIFSSSRLADPASYPKGNGGSFLGIKTAEA
jgi:hypothetical protein